MVDNKTTLDPENDVAYVKWGGVWRMPTRAELEELLNNCTWQWTAQSGVLGYKVTSKSNGNSIFLPATGMRDGMSITGCGSHGYYLSSSLNNNTDTYYLNCGSGFYGCSGFNYRYNGLTVRPVCD